MHRMTSSTSRAVRALPLLLLPLLVACSPATADPAAATASPTAASSAPAASAAPQASPTEQAATAAPEPAASTPSSEPGTGALAALQTLTVKGRAGMGGYDRALYGQAWADTDRNGCDQRNDALRRDLATGQVLKAGTGGCVVLSGTFHDPYSGRDIAFERGARSAEVQIDHVVALADSWQSGAQQWDARTRERFANDPLVLMASDGRLNQQKGASNAASWLPPNKAFRCEYVARQVAIKTSYHLSVTAPERDAIARVLTTCPDQGLPTASDVAFPERDPNAPAKTQAAQPTTKAAPTRTSAPAAPAATSFTNCTEARAAGAAPLHRGDPGWNDRMDRDGDGVACE